MNSLKCLRLFVFKDDVTLMKDMKLNHYRFSISWPRILPSGLKSNHMPHLLYMLYFGLLVGHLGLIRRNPNCNDVMMVNIDINLLATLSGEHINEKGIKYYDDLINMLLDNKITPIVTLYHWDLPQVSSELNKPSVFTD